MYSSEWLVTSLAAQSLLLAVILFALPTRQRLANRLLAVLILTFGARLAALKPVAALPGLMLLHNTAFLLGPLLWLYALALTNPGFRLRARHLWHAVPALSVAAINLALLPDYRRALADPVLIRISVVHGMAASASVIIYAILILRELRGYRRGLRNFYGRLEGIGLRWLQVLAWLVLLAAAAAAAVNLLRLAGQPALNPVSMVVLPASILVVYAVAVFGFRQSQVLLSPDVPATPGSGTPPAVVENRDAEEGDGKTEESGDESARYQRSGLDRARLQRLWLRLDALVASERLWLDPELDLGALASRLDTTPQVLSQVFNTHAGVRFYDYINRLRVAEAQRLLRDPAHRADTILDIALAAGFSSKSTFNKCFRQQTDVTPSTWRKQQDPAAVEFPTDERPRRSARSPRTPRDR